MVDDNKKAQKSAAKPEDAHKGDLSAGDKQHILKEAKILFKKLEKGSISPYANPQYMSGDIHEKVYEAGKDVSSLVGGKKTREDAEKRIKDAIERSDMRVNPLVDGQFRIPYVEAVETASPPLLHAKKIARGLSPEELLAIKKEIKSAEGVGGLVKGVVNEANKFGVRSIEDAVPFGLGKFTMEKACEVDMLSPSRECKAVKDVQNSDRGR